ncbi:carbohydrate esterase family 3 protein [Xylariaceae sp. FL0594]|nr:carbohydrate esterase family 3 protein [Xylariaceae sp. FL0594]
MLFSARTLCRALACVATITPALISGSPIPLDSADESPIISPRGKGFGNGMWLRIMPLGASITWGLTSPDGNGYRKVLWDRLTAHGNQVNMVGSRRGGSMEDNDVEGWPGYLIDQVRDVAVKSVPKYKPNVILLNVGTNDCSANTDIPNAGKRISTLIDDLYTGSPQVTVILSTLLARTDAAAQWCVLDVNRQYRSVAAAQRARGRHLVLVDMQPPAGPAAPSELVDGIHPTEAGYAKMAAIWYNGIAEADREGLLRTKEPIPDMPNGVPARGSY